MSAWEPIDTSEWITSSTVRSVSMTKVIRLLGRKLAPLRAELGRHDAVGVRQQGEAERLLLVELLLLVDRCRR